MLGQKEVLANGGEEADIRNAERTAQRMQQQEDYNIATMTAERAESTGRRGNGAAVVNHGEEKRRQDEQQRKENTDLQLQLAAMRTAENLATQAGAIARGYEEKFEAEFGTNWREDIALRVLDANEYPMRTAGESDADYNTRLEQKMIDKMIDPETGEIKDQYKDHSTLGQYAEWAKARNAELTALRTVDVLNDPNSTAQEKQQSIDNLDKFAEMREFDQEHERLTPTTEASVTTQIQDRTDDAMDHVAVDTGFKKG